MQQYSILDPLGTLQTYHATPVYPTLTNIRLLFGLYLSFALTILVAADILETLIMTTYHEVDYKEMLKMVIVLVIRTTLAYFLGSEVKELEQHASHTGSRHGNSPVIGNSHNGKSNDDKVDDHNISDKLTKYTTSIINNDNNISDHNNSDTNSSSTSMSICTASSSTCFSRDANNHNSNNETSDSSSTDLSYLGSNANISSTDNTEEFHYDDDNSTSDMETKENEVVPVSTLKQRYGRKPPTVYVEIAKRKT